MMHLFRRTGIHKTQFYQFLQKGNEINEKILEKKVAPRALET